MLIADIAEAEHFLSNISYYRLAGYWWPMQLITVLDQRARGERPRQLSVEDVRCICSLVILASGQTMDKPVEVLS